MSGYQPASTHVHGFSALQQMPLILQNLASNLPLHDYPWPSRHVPRLGASPGDGNNITPPPPNLQSVAGTHRMPDLGALLGMFAMDAPVGSASNDDIFLVHALHRSRDKGQTYRQALESLHRVNKHSSLAWKDYYLSHTTRIDELVSTLAEKSPITIRKPNLRIFRGLDRSHSPASRVIPPKYARRAGKPANVVTQYSVPYHVPANHNIPVRSPTPPTLIKKKDSRGHNLFTDEDRDYFSRYLIWELSYNPALERPQLCKKLAEKAPQHSAASWAWHWNRRRDIGDIIAQAKLTRSQRDHAVSRSSMRENKATPGKYDDSEYELDSTSGSEFLDGEEMGVSGAAFTKADTQVLVQFIATTPIGEAPKWSTLSKTYPQRSRKSWGNYFRRHKISIMDLAEKYLANNREGSSGASSIRMNFS